MELPNNNEPNFMKVQVEGFFNKHLGHIPENVWRQLIKARFSMEDSFNLSFSDYDKIIQSEEKQKFENQQRERVRSISIRAKSLENIDNEKAIMLYEEIRDRPNNDALERLIILYRKTKQKDKEIEAIKFLIEEEQNRAYNGMTFLCLKYPERTAEIINCYNKNITFISEFGFPVNFHKKVHTLEMRLLKMKEKK
jgi:tetratricopeptide (TPR) repeat protein